MCYYYIVSLPVILKQPDPATVNVFKTVKFSCTIKGYDIADVTWRKVGSDGLPLTAAIMTKWLSDEVISTLTITLAAGYYSGKYYCVVTNEAGQIISNSASLFVKGI